jgi:hypothetical protein
MARNRTAAEIVRTLGDEQIWSFVESSSQHLGQGVVPALSRVEYPRLPQAQITLSHPAPRNSTPQLSDLGRNGPTP